MRSKGAGNIAGPVAEKASSGVHHAVCFKGGEKVGFNFESVLFNEVAVGGRGEGG